MNIKANWIYQNDAGKMFLVVILYWFSLYIYIPYQSVYLAVLGASSAMIGVVSGAYGYAQIILRLPLGVSADKLKDTKILVVLGTSFPIVASIIRLLFNTVPGYLVANIVAGCGAAMWVNIMVDFSKRIEGRSIQHGTALVSVANQTGILLSFLLSLVLYRDGNIQRILFMSIAAGAIATILALSLKTGAESSPSADDIIFISPLKDALKDKRLWLFSVFGFLQIGLVLSTAQSFSPKLCADLGGTTIEVGLMNVIFMISSVIFSFLCTTKFFKRAGSRIILPAAHIIIATYCYFVPKISSVPLLLVFQILGGIYAGTVVSFAIGEATREITKRNLNSAMAFYQTMVALGISIFPMMTGFFVKNYSLNFGYSVLAIISLAVAVYAAIITKSQTISPIHP